MIVGDRKKFAIEWIKAASLSPIRIWVNDRYIGTLEDEQFLGAVAEQLKNLLNRLDILSLECFPDDDSMFDFLLSEGSGKHILSLGDSFDDFCILVYVKEDEIYFVWRLEPEAYFNYPGYGVDVNFGCVYISDFRRVLNDYKKEISYYKYGRSD